MRVAVVGASSQIGLSLISRLSTAGYQPYPIRREGRGTHESVAAYVFDEVSGSFAPPLDAADAVISLAPLPTVQFAINVAKSLKAKRIIAFGSTGRFSKALSTSAIERDFVARQEHAESLFSNECEAIGIGWTLFRPTMIYGADTDLNVAFITSLIRRFGFFPVPFGAGGLRQPVHVDDLAGACVSALSHEVTINQAYNLGGGEILRFPEFIRRIFISQGKRPFLVPVPKVLFFQLVNLIQMFPKTTFVRKEMVERMYHDLIADNGAAKIDFGYAPRPFLVNGKGLK